MDVTNSYIFSLYTVYFIRVAHEMYYFIIQFTDLEMNFVAVLC